MTARQTARLNVSASGRLAVDVGRVARGSAAQQALGRPMRHIQALNPISGTEPRGTVATNWQFVSSDGPSGASVDYSQHAMPDLELIAHHLAQAPGVVAIYASGSGDGTHIWTVLENWEDQTLDGVFARELRLHKLMENHVARVEFDVIRSEFVDRYSAAWRKIYPNVG